MGRLFAMSVPADTEVLDKLWYLPSKSNNVRKWYQNFPSIKKFTTFSSLYPKIETIGLCFYSLKFTFSIVNLTSDSLKTSARFTLLADCNKDDVYGTAPTAALHISIASPTSVLKDLDLQLRLVPIYRHRKERLAYSWSFYQGCIVTEITRFYCQSDMTSS